MEVSEDDSDDVAKASSTLLTLEHCISDVVRVSPEIFRSSAKLSEFKESSDAPEETTPHVQSGEGMGFDVVR